MGSLTVLCQNSSSYLRASSLSFFLSFHLSCLSPTKTKPIFFRHLASPSSESECLLRRESKDLLWNYSWMIFADINSTIGYGNFLTCLSLSLLLCTYQFRLYFFEATYDTNFRSLQGWNSFKILGCYYVFPFFIWNLFINGFCLFWVWCDYMFWVR